MKKIYLITICSILLLFSCKKYDEIALWNMANDHEQRLTTLEELCSQMNTNINALQAIVSALQNGDYISNIAPIIKNDIEIGYTITFVKNGTITIYHGKDGQKGDKGEQGDSGEGAMPLIGIRQDIDGIHYWTLNNEWLLDGSGKKVKASGTNGLDGENGTNGENGKTPKFKIEGGRWLLSMDNGVTWEDIGQATGDNGQDGTGGDSMFKNIDYTTSNDFVIFTLTDGTELKLSKYGNSSSIGELSITFSETTDIIVNPSIDYEISYTISGANINTVIEAIGLDGFKAEIKLSTIFSGKIVVSAPLYLYNNKKVIIIVSNGSTQTIMKTLTFQYENENILYIPLPTDVAFKEYLFYNDDYKKNYDTDGDGQINIEEALKVTDISISKGVNSFNGIEYFKNLKQFVCVNNLASSPRCEVTSLDLSKNTKLAIVSLSNLPLQMLNISGCTSITDFSLTNCNALIKLYCHGNFSISTINKIYEKLPTTSKGYLYCDKIGDYSIAENKGWKIN